MKIALVASYTKDTITYSDGSTEDKTGGPAFYIGNILQLLNIPYLMIEGPVVHVALRVKENEESVKINFPKKINSIPCALTQKYVIVSPVAHEWPAVSNCYRGKVCIDIQGLVRDERSVGAKKFFSPPNSFKPFLMKAAAVEVKYLPEKLIQKQKERCLLITKGKYGVEAWIVGKKHIIVPSNIAYVKDTIGAGDTFLAYYVAALVKDETLLDAAYYASDMTAEWLIKHKIAIK